MKSHSKIKYNLLLLGIVLLAFFSCNSKRKSITPEIQDITESVYATGIVKSKNQYEVFAPMTGVIEKIFVEEGTVVKQGDPIFKIDNRDRTIATENSRLTAINSDYTINRDKLLASEKALEVAGIAFAFDSLQYQRQKRLWNQNIGSKIEFEQSELKLEKSKAELERVRTNHEDLKREIKLASDQSKNNLKIAQITEDNFIVKSDVNGVVYRLNKEEGELNDGREPVAIIGTKAFILELSIDEKDIVKVNKGQQVLIRMDSYKSQIFEGRIIAIEPMMNVRTRSFHAEAVFIKEPSRLFPNLTAEANIVIQTRENALTIPRRYLINDSSVMLTTGKIQHVEIGFRDYEVVEILSGIDQNAAIQDPSE